MDDKNLFSDKDNCILAAGISAVVGIIASIAGMAMSLVSIIKKKRGESVSKGFTAAGCVLMVFAVAGGY